MSDWLKNTTVIVTGASGGIGKGIAIELIKKYNCRVIGIARNEEKMKKVINELGADAKRFRYRLFDVSKEENWDEFASWLRENKIKPDVLINNAGILPKFARFDKYSIDYIRSAMDINFYAAVYSMHYIMPIILESKKAAVVNIASSAALCSLAGTTVYTASKAAVKGLTEAIREEYRGKCYVGLVCPGFTKTDIFSNQGAEGSAQSSAAVAAMNMISSSCDGMVNKIVHGISRKKELMIFGADAKLMSEGNKLAAVKTSMISSKVMKLSGIPLFSDIFGKKEKKKK